MSSSVGNVDAVVDVDNDTLRRIEKELFGKGYEVGTRLQRIVDGRAAAKAFLSLNFDDQEIYCLLSEFFGIEFDEAVGYLRLAKKVRQIIALKKHCESNGMTDLEFHEYAIKHQLEKRLLSDDCLLVMKPSELKAIIDMN